LRFTGCDADRGGGAGGGEMSNQRTRRIDRVTAEQLLRGVPVDASDGVRGGGVERRLAGVLAAAAAPVRVGELAGEEAAVAAFREARLGPAVESRRQSMIQSALAKLLTVKVAALTIGFTALGGVALAAGTGTLPTPLDKGPSAHPTSSPSAGSREGAGGPESPRPSPSLKGKGAGSKGTPSPSMVGLCRAYAAKPVGARGKALESPAFTALVTAAGGKQNVAAFCKVVLAAKASGAPESPAAVRPTEKPKSSGAPVEPGGKASRPAPSVTPTARVSG
jgi:hypothetical protein